MMNSLTGHIWGFASAGILGLGVLGILLFGVLIFAVIALKGYSLWHAARRGETAWFVALLLVNTLGILELIYIIFILKKFHKAPVHPK